MGFRVEEYPAKWDDLDHPDAVIKINKWGRKYNSAAGPIRNLEMILVGRPDFVIAFPGGGGTANMILQAKENHIKGIKLSYKK